MSEKEQSADKWITIKIVGFVISVVISLVIIWQNFTLKAQNEMIQKDYNNIRDDLNDSEAWRSKGLYDGAKERETEYLKMRTFTQRILNHCLNHKCDLPNDLTVLPSERQFNSLEQLAINQKEK